MNQIVSELNSKILQVYDEFCTVTRTDTTDADVNLFGEWELEKASRWSTILDTYQFSTLSVEKTRENGTNTQYYAPVLVYSDGRSIVREYNYVD